MSKVIKVIDMIFDDRSKMWRITIWRDGKRRVYWRRELSDRLRRKETMKIYQDDLGWRVGDGVNQVAQVFPSEEAAKKHLEKRLRSQAAFDRMMQYPGKIIPVEWLKASVTDEEYHSDTCVCETCIQDYPERMIYLEDDE